jgi:hypothetical protein
MKHVLYLLSVIIFFSCAQQPREPELIDENSFGGELDGKQVELIYP